MPRALDPYGILRVVRPKGALPQAAEALDPSLPIGPDELCIDVERLNIDAASFRQLRSTGRDVVEQVREIVAARGKMHNPVTGSGGVLVGRVREVGEVHPARGKLKPGDRVATLVSLTLTPLSLESVGPVVGPEQVAAKGHAILFASGLWAKLPADLPEPLALAVLDVCGAPAYVARLAKSRTRVLVIGAGKSGSLACAQAARSGAQVIACDVRAEALARLEAARLAHATVVADATCPLEVLEKMKALTGGALCDLVVNCASVPGTEMASILCVKDGGAVLFFSMATSFTAAALGAEGVGKDATLLIGNGYVPGHAELALQLVRDNPRLRELFG